MEGAWFGTVTSEPGSGGDVERSRATARRSGDGWVLDGQKHFGSGLGITSWVLTTAVPEGEAEADWFLLPTGDVPLDGSHGIRLVAPWDGHGMPATQSHAVELVGCPAERVAWPGHLRDFIGADSLAFITIDGLYRAMGLIGRDHKRPQYCDACFTGDYPTALTDQEGGMVSTQLSLLAQPA